MVDPIDPNASDVHDNPAGHYRLPASHADQSDARTLDDAKTTEQGGDATKNGAPRASHAEQPPVAETSTGDAFESSGEEDEGESGDCSSLLASLPPAANGGPPPGRTYYHGSNTEQLLIDGLDDAKRSGGPDAVTQARGQLERYWRLIINEEVSGMGADDIHAALPQLAAQYRANPEDQFIKHRFHELIVRSQTLGDNTLEDRIQAVYRPHVDVMPQAQGGNTACGRTAVAMVTTALTGTPYTEDNMEDDPPMLQYDLNRLTNHLGVQWEAPDLNDNQDRADVLLALREGLPVIVGVGRDASGQHVRPFATGSGHYFVINEYDPDSDSFIYVDPNGGLTGHVKWSDIMSAQGHAGDGKGLLIGRRVPVESA